MELHHLPSDPPHLRPSAAPGSLASRPFAATRFPRRFRVIASTNQRRAHFIADSVLFSAARRRCSVTKPKMGTEGDSDIALALRPWFFSLAFFTSGFLASSCLKASPNSWSRDMATAGHAPPFEDFDDASVFDRCLRSVERSNSLNFVLDFDKDRAVCALDVDASTLGKALRDRDERLKSRRDTRWINIEQPERQSDAIVALADKYGFSNRLRSSMLSHPLRPEPQATEPSPHSSRTQELKHPRTAYRHWKDERRRGHPAAAELEKQVHSDDDAESPTAGGPQAPKLGLHDLNHYRIVSDVWQYVSVDWGYDCTIDPRTPCGPDCWRKGQTCASASTRSSGCASRRRGSRCTATSRTRNGCGPGWCCAATAPWSRSARTRTRTAPCTPRACARCAATCSTCSASCRRRRAPAPSTRSRPCRSAPACSRRAAASSAWPTTSRPACCSITCSTTGTRAMGSLRGARINTAPSSTVS